MLIKSMRQYGWILGLLVAAPSFAQDAAVSMPKIGFMHKTELSSTDDGIQKAIVDGSETKSTHLALKTFSLVLSGNAAQDITYGARYQMVNAAGVSSLDYAWVRKSFMENQGLIVGRAKAKVYGWEHAMASPLTTVTSVGFAHRPFGFVDMVAVDSKYDWGSIALQFAQDNEDGFKNTASRTTKQPAILFEYAGDFGGIMPLVQYGSWDQGGNSLWTVGVGYKTDMFGVSVDHTQDSRSYTTTTDLTDVSSTTALNADFHAGDFKPFIHYSMFDVKQDGTDAEANTVDANEDGTIEDAKPATDGAFNDNASRWAIGVSHLAAGAAFEPYLAYVSTSGKFLTTAGNEESGSEGVIKLGVKGQF